MKTALLPIGQFVVLKRRAAGWVAYFFVPKHLRPDDWPATIPLLRRRLLPDRAKLTRRDQFELQEASRTLLAEMRGPNQSDSVKSCDPTRPRRVGSPRRRRIPAARRSLQTAIAAWKRTDDWNACTDKTREGYGYSIKKIQGWSEEAGHPDPSTITRSNIDRFLSAFNDRPTTKRQTLKALRLVMDQVIALGWRTDNPCAKLKVKVPKTKAVIWERADVDLYVKTAREQGMASIALIILLEWEIGQRLTDVRQFRQGMEYDRVAGVFAFAQSKTDERVIIEVSPTLRDLLNEALGNQLFLFRNERTQKAYTENRLSQTFKWVRVAAMKAEGRYLVLRQLRHSCIVQLARAGCTVPEIASVTGHSLGSVHSILSTYLPRDSVVARNAQVKRGLVAREVGATAPLARLKAFIAHLKAFSWH